VFRERREDDMGKQLKWRGEGRRKECLEQGSMAWTERSIKLKRFLDIDFTSKNCFKALNPRLGYRFHHLIKIKTHLNTTLIGRIRDKQVENLQ